MPTGTVKWFNNAKGYGFILPDQGGEDLFVHYTSILMDGYKTLKAGQLVSFEVIKGGKGLHATNIKSPDAPDMAGEHAPTAELGTSAATTPENSGHSEEQSAAASSDSSEVKAYS